MDALRITVFRVAMMVDLNQFRELGLEDTCCVSSVLLNGVVLSTFYVSSIAKGKTVQGKSRLDAATRCHENWSSVNRLGSAFAYSNQPFPSSTSSLSRENCSVVGKGSPP